MKLRMAWLTILCLALATAPAWADYSNGPINGFLGSWTINFGYIASDTFVADNSNVTGFMIGVWEFPGDVTSALDWSITAAENGGTVYGAGTASGSNVTDQFISINVYGYAIDKVTVTGLNVAVSPSGTYWLNLQNAVVSNGDPLYWDENRGQGCQSNGCPSKASENAVGTIFSEAFTVNTSGGTTPEPNSFVLLASGVLGLAGLLRRKLG
jgi:opacity protein-like surface antigen